MYLTPPVVLGGNYVPPFPIQPDDLVVGQTDIGA